MFLGQRSSEDLGRRLVRASVAVFPSVRGPVGRPGRPARLAAGGARHRDAGRRQRPPRAGRRRERGRGPGRASSSRPGTSPGSPPRSPDCSATTPSATAWAGPRGPAPPSTRSTPSAPATSICSARLRASALLASAARRDRRVTVGCGTGTRPRGARPPRAPSDAAGTAADRPAGARGGRLLRLDHPRRPIRTPASTRCSTAGCRAPGTSPPRSWPRTARSPPPVDRRRVGLAGRGSGGPRPGVRALPVLRALPGPAALPVGRGRGLAGDVRAHARRPRRLARRRARRLSTSLVLDALVGILAASARRASRCCTGPSWRLAAPGTPSSVVAVNLAYPVLDLALLVVFIGVLLAYELRPPPAAWVLAAGVVGFAVVDAIFVYQSAAGTFRPGTLLSSASLVVMALVAVVRLARPARPAPAGARPLPSVVLPGLFALVCLGLLVVATAAADPRARRRPRRDRRGRRDRPHGPVVPGRPVAGRAPAGGPHRRADRPGEPAGVQRGARAGAGPARPDRRARAAGRRPRRLQGRQRLPRPPLRGRAPPAGRSAPPAGGAVRRRGGRIGGDEFAVLLADADSALAVRIAERLRAGFRRPVPPRPRARGSSPRASGSRWRPTTATTRSSCSSTRTWRCTRRRPPGAGRPCSAGSSIPRGASGWRPPSDCAMPCAAARSSCTTSRWSRSAPARSPGWRHWPGGEHPEEGLVLPSGFLQQMESGGSDAAADRRRPAAGAPAERGLARAGTLADPGGEPVGDQSPRPLLPRPGGRPARWAPAAGRNPGAGTHRGPVHGRSGPGAGGDPPAARRRGLARRRRLRHGLQLPGLPPGPARHPGAEAGPLLRRRP